MAQRRRTARIGLSRITRVTVPKLNFTELSDRENKMINEGINQNINLIKMIKEGRKISSVIKAPTINIKTLSRTDNRKLNTQLRTRFASIS